MIAWLLVGYMWLVVHRPHEAFSRLAGIPIVQIYMICVTLIWLFSLGEKRIPRNIITAALLLYLSVIAISTLFSSYTDILTNAVIQSWLRYLLFFLILMTSVKTERDLKIILTGFIVAFFLWMAHSYRGYLAGNVHYSAGAYRIIPVGVTFSNANDYGTLLVCALPMIVPLITICKRYWHYLFVLGYVLLTLRSVLLTGSRGALIMLAALTILPVLLSRYRFRLLPVILIAVPFGWMSMSEEMKNRYRTIWDSTISDVANQNVAGRTQGFYDGMINWSNSPILGVGPGQHGPALGSQFQSHNLYGQVAGEMGTLGIIAFLFLLSCFGINHYNIWQNYKYLQEKNLGKEGLYCWRVSVAVMYAVVMLLLQGLSLHVAFWFHWIWFGAFQALAVMLMQEKVDAAIKKELLPSPPRMSIKKAE